MPGILLMSLFVPLLIITQCSHYYWHGGSFKMSHFLNFYFQIFGGARGVMVIVVGNEHGDTSSNPGRD